MVNTMKKEQRKKLTYMKTKRHIQTLVFTVLLLLAGGMTYSAWAAKVTYHILTLPMDSESNRPGKTIDTYDGWSTEAIKVTVDNATTPELPAHYQSPLATNFQYYAQTSVEKYGDGTAQKIYDNSANTYILYKIKDGEKPLPANSPITSNCDIYVTYEYNASNGIAKLDGSESYNILVTPQGQGQESRFLAYNRGRNNRPASIGTSIVSPEQVSSSDFTKVDIPKNYGITTWWNGGLNNEAEIGSQFYFMFKFQGEDPYNISIMTAYTGDKYFVDNDNNKVRDYYRGGTLFGVKTEKMFFTSDIDVKYTTVYNSDAAKADPTLVASEPKPGYHHKAGQTVYNSFALLNNNNSTGYVFMGTRIPAADGTYYLKADKNDLYLNKMDLANASKSYTIAKDFYQIKTFNFKVTTQFGNTQSASFNLSEYYFKNADIEISIDDIPEELQRKYCTFTRFYKDAALTQEITKYSQVEGSDIYVAYEVSDNAPFKAISKDDSYTTATWYELTDAGSTQESNKKLKWDSTSSTFKNNGASGVYDKLSEFAFVGDPYELKVLYRNDSETAGANSYVTLSTYDAWDIPDDDTDGSFLLRKFNDTGHWNWDAGNQNVAINYSTKSYTINDVTSNPQTVTLNISGLNGSKYYKITTGGTDASHIISTSPTANYVVNEAGSTTATVTVTLASADAAKTMTVSIQEYNNEAGTTTNGSPVVVTINQTTTSYAGSALEYSTTSSTRVKVMELPQRTFTYKVVDREGRIAVAASASQTIFSPLSIASIPSIIISPFLQDEAVTFYDTYTDGAGRNTLAGPITQTPNVNHDIFVKYTTSQLANKPIKLNDSQEFFVRVNGLFIYYDTEDNSIKTSANYAEEDKYKWKLRNRDPYAMLIDNLEARKGYNVEDVTESVNIYDDNGGSSSESRQKGAWVKLSDALANAVGLTFDTDRSNAQRFVAKMSTQVGVYEVMVATGAGVDVSTTYYSIGCPAENTVQVYDNEQYAHGDNKLKFNLEQSASYTYHLIDKAKHELLTVTSKSPDLVLPAEYQSPLVATYHYYTSGNITETTVSGKTEYTPTDPNTELASIAALYATFTTYDSDATAYTNSGSALTATSADDVDTQARRLTSTGDFYYNINNGASYKKVTVSKAFDGTDIYVTYDKNDLVTFNDAGSPYLLKFLDPLAEGYFLEDGNDKLTTEKIQAVYPYTNGDGNLNIYGQRMNEEQMGGGANTRPRWVWFFESDNNDPYHVKIHSKSTISFNSLTHTTYLHTYAVHFNQDAEPETKHIVTGGNLSGITSIDPTEYMVLGTEGQYRLLTSNTINDGETDERRYVTSFEQYWKTYNMVKLHILGLSKSTNSYSEDEATWTVPNDPASYRTTLAGRDWHSYNAYASAVRWNGYNDKSDGLEKKVVEHLEHWFQTFDMGNGTFDIESANIPPVLVLLDRHGWEIMRRPLPKASTYPNGDELDALKEFDSPLVKEYHFYSNATKATGCHKYILRTQNGKLRDEIKVSGTAYTSTSLGSLPPLSASGVKDNAGILQDQYVTYTVKEEYEKSYKYTLTADTTKTDGKITNITYTETGEPSKFLIVQNARYARLENAPGEAAKASYISKPVRENTDPEGGSIYDLILKPKNSGTSSIVTNNELNDTVLWYVEPNLEIDDEMGIMWAESYGGSSEPFTKAETKVKYKDKTGFDPYNIQIRNAKDGRYFTMDLASTTLDNGIWRGTLNTDSITLKAKTTSGYVTPEGYDHTTLQITKQTFMAVQDDKGNMQLMPRFDNTKRVNTDANDPWFTTLKDPVDHTRKAEVTDRTSTDVDMGAQTTFFVRPIKYVYHIIDNEGNVALSYKTAGEYYPSIPDHFKSPLATNFGYYKTAPTYNYETKTLTVTDSIAGSFAGAGLNATTNNIYVRYTYNANADESDILKGKWFTVDLAGKNLQSSGTIVTADIPETEETDETGTGVSLYSGTRSSDAPIDGADGKRKWQWKFLVAPTESSSLFYKPADPYAVQIFNRAANYTTNFAESPNPMATGIKVNGTDRFSLLSHPSGGYALVTAGSGPSTYNFLNGGSMTTSVAATTDAESSFTSRTNTISDDALLILNDDVEHNYTYNVITNDASGNKLAISGTQSNAEAVSNNFEPLLPTEMQTPLLNLEDYTYYGSATESDGAYTVNGNTVLTTLYGLYDDIVYVRYGDYDPNKTEYLIPNKKDVVDSKVARHAESNDVALNLEGKLPYNIIWENDNMMKATDSDSDEKYDHINYDGSHALSGAPEHVWELDGNDPYAIQIKHRRSEKYAVGTDALSDTPTNTFMLLKKTGYPYGILQETGSDKRLSGYGQTTTTDDPNKFIIFGLSTHKLIYHFVIANIGSHVDIPYRAGDETTYDGSVAWAAKDTTRVHGTSLRDIKSIRDDEAADKATGDKYQLGETISLNSEYVPYCYDAGQISLGDVLRTPTAFYRPNCSFDYYIEGVYDDEACTTPIPLLNNKYKGLKLENLMSDAELIGKTVLVNIVYSFDKSLATNSGTHFVKSYTDNLWYTFETQEASVPWLARYTNTQKMTAISGRETHYTNDYLFTPVGDVYGFKMYNRYVLKNSSESTETDDSKVMTTPTLNDGETVDIAVPANGYEVYELLTGDTEGYFRVHPVVNYNDGTNPYTAVYVNIVDNKLKLSTTPRDWTYGLSTEMLQPYYLGAGNVGALNATGKASYKAVIDEGDYKITDLQAIVYNDDNIVHFTSGKYRLYSQPGIAGISPVRYASGYLHDTELTAGEGSTPIPMHFYSRQGVSTTFAGEGGLTSGFTVTNATRGEIPVPATEYDPSTIFHVAGSVTANNPTISNVTMSSQGLNVIGNNMGTGTATTFRLTDIGAGVIHLKNDATGYYLNFIQTGNVYDLKYSAANASRVDDVKWCMEPADTLGLRVTTNDGGDDYYYTTFYAPFDVELPANSGDKTYTAYYSERWIPNGIHVKSIEGRGIPAGTPVIIRTSDNAGNIKLSIPSESVAAVGGSNIFSGSYLEKLLDVDAAHDVYTLGLPFISDVEKDDDYDTTGEISAPLPEQDTKGVGFYINATPNKEVNVSESMWTRNNRYVLHNKIYYRATGGGDALELAFKKSDYIPVIFDDEELELKDNSYRTTAGDGRVYDLQGRCVATEQEVSDGSWLNNIAPGMYIVNGKKFVIE